MICCVMIFKKNVPLDNGTSVKKINKKTCNDSAQWRAYLCRSFVCSHRWG